LFYERAIDELLEEFSIAIQKAKKKRKIKEIDPVQFTHLYELDGTKITSLLNINPETRILIASDKSHFLGVEFEDVRLTELKESVPLKQIADSKTAKFSNTEILPQEPPLTFTKKGK